jgi:hypothetical protein
MQKSGASIVGKVNDKASLAYMPVRQVKITPGTIRGYGDSGSEQISME